jgi:hypothetical protein
LACVPRGAGYLGLREGERACERSFERPGAPRWGPVLSRDPVHAARRAAGGCPKSGGPGDWCASPGKDCVSPGKNRVPWSSRGGSSCDGSHGATSLGFREADRAAASTASSGPASLWGRLRTSGFRAPQRACERGPARSWGGAPSKGAAQGTGAFAVPGRRSREYGRRLRKSGGLGDWCVSPQEEPATLVFARRSELASAASSGPASCGGSQWSRGTRPA